MAFMRSVPWPIRKAPLIAGLAASTLPAKSAKDFETFALFLMISDIQWPTSVLR